MQLCRIRENHWMETLNPESHKLFVFSLLFISAWCLWSHSTRPFVFCYFSAAFFTVPACINVSRPPHRLLIYESYPGLSLLSPVGGIDVESITGRIASCPQISWILFWQPVASSIPDLFETLEDNKLKCCMKFQVVSFSLADHFSYWGYVLI